MGATGEKLTGPARRQKADEAYRLAIRRVTYGEIGKALDISRQLASRLVQEEQERMWSGRDLTELTQEKKRSIETYEAVIRGAWQRLGRVQDNSLNVSGLFNSIINAQKAIDDITGAKAPFRSEIDGTFTYSEWTGTAREIREIDVHVAELEAEIAQAEASEIQSSV